MKILLVDPPAHTDDYDKAYPNIGLLHLISYVRERTALSDEDILFLDAFHTVEDHVRAVERHRPDVYGISFAFLTQRVAYEAIRAVKARFPDLLVVAGGPHPTADPQDVLRRCPADLVAIGEGETLLAEIVEKVSRRDFDFHQTPGLALRDGDRVVLTPRRPVVEDLDSLPPPAWDRVDFSKFIGQHYCKDRRQAGIVISRGCPFRCTFCSLPVWRVSKPYVRMRSPESIAREVDWLYQLGVREIKIVSDEINASLPWAKDVCRAIATLGHRDLYFQGNLRARPMDDELAGLFRRMNMWLVHLGCESASDRVLRGIRKKVTVRQVEDCLRVLKRHRVGVLLFMMAWNLWEEKGRLCWESPREAVRSLLWGWKQFWLGRVRYMTWSIATPMPGAPLFDIVERHGLHSADQVLADWDRNKDYPGTDLRPLGVSEFVRLGMLRLGILSKGFFALASGGFDWRRNFYRVGILLRSFLGVGRRRGAAPGLTFANTPLQPKVEG